MGPQIRVGALDAAGRIVDLAAALRFQLIDEGLAPDAAARLSAALLPQDMVGADRGRRAFARRRPPGARLGVASRRAVDGVTIANDAEWLQLLAPIPRPPMLRDFMGFEQHLLNIFPKLGREIPPEWYKLPVYYKGNPGSIAANGDDIPDPVVRRRDARHRVRAGDRDRPRRRGHSGERAPAITSSG